MPSRWLICLCTLALGCSSKRSEPAKSNVSPPEPVAAAGNPPVAAPIDASLPKEEASSELVLRAPPPDLRARLAAYVQREGGGAEIVIHEIDGGSIKEGPHAVVAKTDADGGAAALAWGDPAAPIF